MSRRYLWAALVIALAACGEQVTAVEVRIEARPASSNIAALEVSVANNGQMTSRTFDVSGQSFPLTYTITPTGRTGTISTSLRAFDATGALRGVGSGATTIEAKELASIAITLEPADFVVNGDVAGDQVLAYRVGDSGRQVGAAGNRIAVVFVNDCPDVTSCPVLLRVLDQDGLFVGEADIAVNIDSVKGSVPAVAVSEQGILATWQADDNSIRALALRNDGGAQADSETIMGMGAEAADPAVAALSSGEFVVVWTQDAAGAREIRGRILDATGAPVAPAFPITVNPGTPLSPSVAATGNERAFGVAWIEGGEVMVRFFGADGSPQSASGTAVLGVTGAQATSARAAMTPDGDVVVAFGASGGDAGAGAYMLGRFSGPDGTPVHGLIELATAPNASTPPAVAIGESGEMAVVWQGSDEAGAGIFWQRLTAASDRVGEPRQVNTTVTGDQTGPAVAATPEGFAVVWTDDSRQEPDTSQRAIRARVLYP